jgi:hypothetical protein
MAGLALQAASALAQTPPAPPTSLEEEAAASGQTARLLATNLRGDMVQLLRDRPEGSRRQATLALVLRTPAPLRDVPDALRQVDEVALDCAASTRSVWRSEVYPAADAVNAPVLRVQPPPAERTVQRLADLASAESLMAAAMRALCSGTLRALPGPTPAPPVPVAMAPATPDPGPSESPGAPGTPGVPGAPGTPTAWCQWLAPMLELPIQARPTAIDLRRIRATGRRAIPITT